MSPSSSRSRGTDQDLELGPALAQLLDLADVVVVMVGEQHVRRLEAEAIGRLDQRLDRAAGVDEEGRTALTVGDEEGVRDELRVERALDDHAAILGAGGRVRGDELAQSLQVGAVADVAAPLEHGHLLGPARNPAARLLERRRGRRERDGA